MPWLRSRLRDYRLSSKWGGASSLVWASPRASSVPVKTFFAKFFKKMLVPLSREGRNATLFAWIPELLARLQYQPAVFCIFRHRGAFGGRALDGYFVVQIQSPSRVVFSRIGCGRTKVRSGIPYDSCASRWGVSPSLFPVPILLSASAFWPGKAS